MNKISLDTGFGPIKFGTKPSEVLSTWGQETYYEDWMGGNLENFLYFKGLLVGFSGECTEHPTEKSGVSMFQVKTVHPLEIWGHEITDATSVDIIRLLNENQVTYETHPNNIIRCIDLELQFDFTEEGKLDLVYFAC